MIDQINPYNQGPDQSQDHEIQAIVRLCQMQNFIYKKLKRNYFVKKVFMSQCSMLEAELDHLGEKSKMSFLSCL